MIGLQTRIRKYEKHKIDMNIRVKYFASLRERIGQGETTIAANLVKTVADVWLMTTNNLPMPENTLMAVNMEYVDSSCSVKEGDEVAFFPPVTGG